MKVKELFEELKEQMNKGNGEKHIIVTHCEGYVAFSPDYISAEDDLDTIKDFVRNSGNERLLEFNDEKVAPKDVILLGN